MNSRQVSHVFTAVDAQEDSGRLIQVLDVLRAEPFYAAYKARVIQLVQPHRGGRYLDVGAGTGDDARSLMERLHATVVAVDVSRIMMREAVRRGLPASAVGDAAFLPFPENTFDGCWADRTFQHLAEPRQALLEIVRVTKAGGRIVVVDPDYDTQVMEFPDQDLARRVLRFRAECGLRNGTLAHAMPGMFTAIRLSDVHVEARTLIVRDPAAVDHVMGLRTWAASARSIGCLSQEDVERWEALFDETVRAGRFFYAVTFFMTVGTKTLRSYNGPD